MSAGAEAGQPHPEVEELLLGGGRAYTRQEVAERAGVGLERTRQIWRALGFAAVDDEARVFTDADAEALRAGERLIAAGLITEESETMMARALGHHLSRLAEWQVHALWTWAGRDPARPVDGAALLEHATVLLPEMELLQRHVWRRHLAAYAGRALAGAAAPGGHGEARAGAGTSANGPSASPTWSATPG
ncbi:hypothetical protein NQP46_18690 [Streptomyces albus]|nr:hypothetical protein NQP46_18690 [Streptomyces albus]